MDEKKAYFDNILEVFVNKFIVQRGGGVCNDDFVMNYALCSIFLTTLLLQMKDTAKEADGNRNLINQKLLLTIFKSLGTYSKYAIEMFISIAQVESLLTDRLAEEFKWGYFHNWRGGVGHNMEDDLAHEITNRISKNIVKRMGPNKTIDSISRVCKATSGIKEIIENFDSEFDIHGHSVEHSKRSSLEDEKEMIADILTIYPFIATPGRLHPSFPDIKRYPQAYLNITEFHQWLDKHKNEISLYL